MADSEVAVTFLVSSGYSRAAPAPDGGEDPPPPCARGGRREGQIILLEGDRADDLEVSRLVHGQP